MEATKRRAGVLLAATVAVIGCWAGNVATAATTSAAARSADPGPVRLTPQASSSRYLVYTRLRASRATNNFGVGGLFVLPKGSHHPRRLASINEEYDSGYSLAGSMLIFDSYKYTGLFGNILMRYTNWFNLKTGESGQATDGSTYTEAAAPDGWITLDFNNGELADQPTSGPAVSLGRPVPQSTRPFVTAGANKLVVYSVFSDDSEGNGEMRVMSFAHPGVWRTVIPHLKDAAEEDYYCPSVTAAYVACVTEGARNRLIPLDGSAQVKTTKGCPHPGLGEPWVMHHSAAWRGCHGRLTILSPHGKLHVSKHRYGWPMAPAYGELAVATRSHKKIEIVSSAKRSPKLLVSATS